MSDAQVIEYDKAAAERRAERITLRLDAIADNYAAVMPMIREAIEKRDDIALGYNSPGAYVADRFGGSLQRLGVETRRTVVKELTAAGMSTRAIAPVVGTSHKTVVKDTQAIPGGTEVPPDTHPLVNTDTGEVSDDYVTDQADLGNPTEDETSGEVTPDAGARSGTPEPQRPVKTTGLDGKTYTRSAPGKPKRTPLTDSFWKATYDLQKITERLERLHEDDRFERNKNEVAARNRNYLVQARDLIDQILADLPN